MAWSPALSTPGHGKIYVGSKFRDSFSLLDVVYANQFKGLRIDPRECEQTEKNFYRGAPPTWLNFHISEQNQAKSKSAGATFIKRDGYDTLRRQILRQRKNSGTLKVKLLHQQGCGGTTLAMQVLWDLRKTFRCAAFRGLTSDIKNVVKEVVHLFTAGCHGNYNTVLLLMNDEFNLDSLQNSIMAEIAERDIDTEMPVVIILNCVRASEHAIHKKEQSYEVKKKQRTEERNCVILKRELSDKEKITLNEKKQELCKRYGDECLQFHGFNILETNFSQEYIQEACVIFKNIKRKKRPQKTQLAAYLSLLNAYVPGSYLLESQCLNYLDLKGNLCAYLSLEDQMDPFSHLIVTFQPNVCSEKAVRMAHPLIAQCCTELLAEGGVARSDTARNFLTCFCASEVHPYLFGFIRHMLTKREAKTGEKNNDQVRDDRGPKKEKEKEDDDLEKFSRLILQIEETEGKNMSASILKVASDKFDQNAFLPQALSRFYYREVEDYNKAEIWAKTAKEREPTNSLIADTVGQVYKNQLRNKESEVRTPREILQLAKKAIEAFEEEEKLAETENLEDDGKTNILREFNTRGTFAYLQVCNIMFDQLVRQNDTWSKVLTKNESMGSVLKLLGDNKLFAYKDFVNSLREGVERRFEFLDTFLTYSKPYVKKSDALYIFRVISECYKKYVGDSAPKHKDKSITPIQNLKEKLAATSAGVLSCRDGRCTVAELEQIASWWKEICFSEDSNTHALVNFILANIMLANENKTPSSSDYQALFTQQTQASSREVPEFYMVKLLILWPTDDEDKPVSDLNQLIRQLKDTYRFKYQKMFRSRYPCPLFFWGNRKGLSRNVNRRFLEILWTQNALLPSTTNWRSESIFKDPNVQNHLQKVKGVVRNYRLYAAFKNTEIEVDVNKRYSLWKSGPASFYLGFTISGPVAYKVRRLLTFEGPSGKLEACGGVEDFSGWTKLHPAVKTTDEGETLSLKSEAGSYECSVSAMRWVCKENVTFTYQFCSWEEHSEMPKRQNCIPAGPLLDIVVSAGKITELHLPHWIDCGSTSEDMFTVLHVDSCGYSIEPVSKVTPSHIILNEPTFTSWGGLIKETLGLSVYCDMLMYKQTKKEFLTLHVYLVRNDRYVQKELESEEQRHGSKLITKPKPDMSLQLNDEFCLMSDEENVEISPGKLTLRYDSRNFFEVFVRGADDDFGLRLESLQKKSGTEKNVWTCTIRKGDYKSQVTQQEQASGGHFVDRHWVALIQRLADTAPLLDELRDKKLISKEKYGELIRLQHTQTVMRKILEIVTSAGSRAKDTFYDILRNTEGMKYLIKDLEEST